MRLSLAQRDALAKWDRYPGLQPYGAEYATVNSLRMRGLMECPKGLLKLTERGREALARKTSA
jgi:hypothetical protein